MQTTNPSAPTSAPFTNLQVTPTSSRSIVTSMDIQIGNALWTTVVVTEDGFAVWGLSVRKAIVR